MLYLKSLPNSSWKQTNRCFWLNILIDTFLFFNFLFLTFFIYKFFYSSIFLFFLRVCFWLLASGVWDVYSLFCFIKKLETNACFWLNLLPESIFIDTFYLLLEDVLYSRKMFTFFGHIHMIEINYLYICFKLLLNMNYI